MAHPKPDLRQWLALPARAGASRVVFVQLERVLASQRTLDRDEPETLHDFRVAVRRLRSLLRAYQDVLGKAAPKRVRRMLRTVAHATNPSRDADVHAEWILSEREALRVAERRGADWLRARIEEDRPRMDMALDDALSGSVRHTLHQFRTRLRKVGTAVQDGRPNTHQPDTLASETARQINRLADELTRALQAISAPTQDHTMHVARIAAKHLRYVLEPFADRALFAELPVFIERLRMLQDVLGELHDTSIFASEIAGRLRTAGHDAAREIARAIRVHVASDSTTFHRVVAEAQLRDPVPGLLALAERLRSRHEAAYERVHQEWLANYASIAVLPAYDIAAAIEACVPVR